MSNDATSSEKPLRSGNKIFWSSLLWTIGWAAFFGFGASQNPGDTFNLQYLSTHGYSISDAISEMLIYFVPITFFAFTLGDMFVHWVMKLTGFTASVAMLVCTFGAALIGNEMFNPWF